VTVCAFGRRFLFGAVMQDEMRLSPLGEVVRREWTAIATRWGGVELDAFAVMPNHLHGIVALTGAGRAPPLQTIIGSFKAGVSRRAGCSVWQRSFYDRVIRDDEELRALREYVEENPLRWALDLENPASR